MTEARGGPYRHVYVHFPFCARKCPYCDFNSHARREGETDAYIDALLLEATRWADVAAPETIFVGGGTPTHCDASQLERYLSGLVAILGSERLVELTVEANPGSLTAEKVAALRRAGTHRVSMGAQSFVDRHLEALGRIHGAEDTARSVAMLREGGVPRVSLDLILAVPDQTLEEQAFDVQRAIELRPDHISAYVLTYEEGTVFTKRMRQGHLPPPRPSRELRHLHLVCERLAPAGYRRYEISNFARPGEESLHNLAYWRNVEWLGLGAGAHSHGAGRRWKNVDDPAGYATAVQAGRAPTEWTEDVGDALRLFESLMMGLRLVEGVDLDLLEARHGIDVRVEHGALLEQLEAEKLLRVAGSRLVLTTRGLDVANAVIATFYPDES